MLVIDDPFHEYFGTWCVAERGVRRALSFPAEVPVYFFWRAFIARELNNRLLICSHVCKRFFQFRQPLSFLARSKKEPHAGQSWHHDAVTLVPGYSRGL
jgi:hypothetical protein